MRAHRRRTVLFSALLRRGRLPFVRRFDRSTLDVGVEQLVVVGGAGEVFQVERRQQCLRSVLGATGGLAVEQQVADVFALDKGEMTGLARGAMLHGTCPVRGDRPSVSLSRRDLVLGAAHVHARHPASLGRRTGVRERLGGCERGDRTHPVVLGTGQYGAAATETVPTDPELAGIHGDPARAEPDAAADVEGRAQVGCVEPV